MLQRFPGHRLAQGAAQIHALGYGKLGGGLQQAFLDPAGQNQVAAIAVFGEAAEEFDAIHAGHVEIADEQVDGIPPGQFRQGFGGIFHRQAFTDADAGQQNAELPPRHRVVIHHQNMAGQRPLPGRSTRDR